MFIILACMLLSVIHAPTASGQTEFNRISAVERSDGLGYVIRYHLSEAADSFRVSQPEADLIQMKIFASDLDTTGIRVTEPNESIQGIHLYDIPDGFGIEIELHLQNYYQVRAYKDQNQRDLLLALTESTFEEVSAVATVTDRILWEDSIDDHDHHGDMVQQLGGMFDAGYTQIHDNLNFDTVIIDAGHGGRDPGSIGHGGIYEKNITLAVALKLGGYIEEYMPDVRVVYTRDDDRFLPLDERGSIANRERGDLFVSIHANATGSSSVTGSEIYFLGQARTQSALEVMKRENSVVRLENGNGIDELSEEDLLIYELANAGNISISERIAEKLEYQFRERAQRPSRGVKQAGFMVLYHASMPALMVELGFITNPGEARYLSSEYGQSIVASAIFRAIRDYKDEYERSRDITRSH